MDMYKICLDIYVSLLYIYIYWCANAMHGEINFFAEYSSFDIINDYHGIRGTILIYVMWMLWILAFSLILSDL